MPFATGLTVPELVLGELDWRDRERIHRNRVDDFCAPHRRRAQVGEAHPVWDFLFTYYRLRPRQLRIWHPGFGVALGGVAAERYLGRSGYGHGRRGVEVTREHLLARAETVRFIACLLRAMASRPARLNCFGLHEWAMVYRSDTTRHRAPLRLGAAGTDAVVESLPLRCTHFDAFRFFTGPARPRNSMQLSRAQQSAVEQPGCIHAVMDLYKWGVKLLPLVDSDVVMDAFELAYEARVLDMRASPYDLRAFGYQPIPIETAAGRADYVRQQSALSQRGAAVRASLLSRCHRLHNG